MHGIDAALKAARAFSIAGLDATSNLLAGSVYGVPVSGTMAHSFIQAHDSEMAAFRAFARQFPATILLVDTYDTLDGVQRVIELSHELGEAFRVRGVRLDSGDLGGLAKAARDLLDEAGLSQVKIFASGGLDETEIARLIAEGAPIEGFGIGTALGVSQDAPGLDIAYKLVAYEGRGRLKLSAGKPICARDAGFVRRSRWRICAGAPSPSARSWRRSFAASNPPIPPIPWRSAPACPTIRKRCGAPC
jgi:nicotinate phosphoribosyltransferase